MDKLVDDVVEAVEAPAPDTFANPADDARNDVANAIKQLKGETAAEPETVVDAHPEPIEAEDTRARGADGKFIPKAEAAPKEAAPAPEITPSVDDQTKASAPASTPTVAPPAGWTAAEKADWSKLPPAIQTAVSRREAEIANGGRQWSEEKRQYQTILAPIEQASRARGLDVGQGTQLLVAAQNALDANPVDGIRRIMATYGVTPEQLASHEPAPQAQVRSDPVVPQLTQRLSALEAHIEESRTSQLKSEIDSFSKGKPHFAAVKEEMSRIALTLPPELSTAEILERAYEQAVWVNADVRAKMIADQQAKADAERTAALKAKETSSRKAAVSIKGSSNGVMPVPKVNSGGDVYDDVRAAINSLRQ